MAPIVEKQDAMKRNAKKSGATLPPKKLKKTIHVKDDAQTVSSPAHSIGAGAESVVAAKIEPEVKPMAIETVKPAIKTAQDATLPTETKEDDEVDLSHRDEKAGMETVPTIKTTLNEANSDGKNAISALLPAAVERAKETVARPIKVTGPDSVKKRKKVVASSATEGDYQTERNSESVAFQDADKEKQPVGNVSSDKKEGVSCKLTSASEVEEAARDEDNVGEEDAEGEQEDQVGEDTDNGEDIEIECGEEDNEEGHEDDEEAAEGDDVEHLELQEPRAVTERQKRRKLEVFVGGLDKDASEDDVKKAFEQVGEVVEVRLVRNPFTGKNKGYAFVRFTNADQATRATSEMRRTQIRGKTCGVLPSDDNDVLYLGNINRTWKKEQVEEKLKEYGIEDIEELTLMEDPKNEGMNRGFGFLELATHNAAIQAYQRLQKPDAIFGFDTAKVAWAKPHNEPDDEVMSQVKSVFVDGMPVAWSEEKVREQFGKFGEIERIVLACNMPNARRKDFAFVNFATRESAIACLDTFKDIDLIDGDNKVKVKVTLAKPAPKRKPETARGGIWGDHRIGYPRLKGSKGPPGFNMDPWRPGRGGRGFVRGGNRESRRFTRRSYDNDDDDDANVHRLLRALRQVAEEDRYTAERSRSRSRWSPGPPLRPLKGSRGGYSRREGVHSRATYSTSRPSYEYRSSSRRVFRGDYSHQSSARESSRPSRPPPRDDYSRRVDRGHDYDRDTYSRVGDHIEPSPGMKRPVPSMDDAPSYYDSGAHGYPRARIDHGYDAPPPPSRYDSVRSPLDRSGPGRGPIPPMSGVTVPQTSRGSYDHQPGGFSGPSYGNASSSSLYGSGNHGYRSVLSGASDYISSAGEMGGGGPLYGSGSGGYNNLSGAGSGSYY